MGVFPTLILKPDGGIPTNGLIAEYLFNNNFLDTSGSGFNGTNNGTTFVTDRNSASNSAIFVGSGNFVQLGNIFTGLTDNFSISLWFKTASATGLTRMLTKRGSPTEQWDMSLIPTSTEVGFFDGSVTFTTTTGGFADNAWRHICIVINGSSSEFFMNGTGDGTFSPTITTSNDNVNIGSIRDGVASMDGNLDDIRVYNRVLTQAEITILANE